MNFRDYLNKNSATYSNSNKDNGEYGLTITFDNPDKKIGSYNKSDSSYSKGNHYSDHSSYDSDEVDMVLGDLKKINDLSYKLYDMIKKGDCELEDWLQVKISQACDRLSSAHDYLKYRE